MLRRAFVLALPLLRADDRSDALDAIAPLATALSEGDAAAILRVIPKDQEELRTHLLALVARTESTSSVRIASADGDSAELDWYLEIRNRTTQTVVERRRGTVQLKHRGRKIVSLTPASFFAPPANQ